MTAGGALTIAAAPSGSVDVERPRRSASGKAALTALAVSGVAIALALGWRVQSSAARSVASRSSATEKSPEIVVSLTTKPPGARLYLDGRRLEANPFVDKRPRDGSAHRVRAEADHHEPVELDLSYDADVSLELTLDRAAPVVAVGAVAPESPPQQAILPAPARPARAPTSSKPAAAGGPASDSASTKSTSADPDPEPVPPRSATKPAGLPFDTELPWNDKKR